MPAALPLLERGRAAAEVAVEWVAFGIEIVAAIVLVVATLRAIGRLLRAATRGTLPEDVRGVRLAFGRGLVLALEFLVAADVLRTMIAPTLDRLLLVGAVVLLRTVLALAVEYEISRMDKEGTPVK